MMFHDPLNCQACYVSSYQANNPTNAAVSNDTNIPANNIIGTYLDTKSDVFDRQSF